MTRDRRPALAETSVRQALRDAFRAERARRPFAVDAIVLLPDHLHAIWTLPEGDADFPTRWRRIKALTTSGLGLAAGMLWQGRYWEHTIRDERDLRAHMDYIHFNPVRHGLAAHPAAWPWSSLHRHVRLGTYPADWANAPDLTLPHD